MTGLSQPTGSSTSTDTTRIYTALNVSPLQRKVILKKVDGADYNPLPDAVFTVLYADKQTVVRVEDKDSKKTELKELPSGAGGAFFIGKLPFGTYYLVEKAAPSDYAGNAGKVFKLTVDDSANAGTIIGDDTNKPVGQLTNANMANDEAMLKALRELLESIKTASAGDNPPDGTGD